MYYHRICINILISRVLFSGFMGVSGDLYHFSLFPRVLVLILPQK